MDLRSVHEIFTNKILRIPSYQRGYSWSNNKLPNIEKNKPLKNVKGQLKDLWEDILNIPEDGWHYTGLLTLVKEKNKEYDWLKDHEKYSIVDGQQRITSILILLSVIIEEANKIKYCLGVRDGDAEFQYLYIEKGDIKAYIFGYEKDNPSDKYFRQHILKLDEIEDDSKESVYTENLLKARIFFSYMVEYYIDHSPKSKEEDLKFLFDTITTNLKLNVYILPDELDEYVVFETMNNRGKPLSQLEKLKNRLLYLNDKFEIDESDAVDKKKTKKLRKAQRKELKKSINTAWITIYQSLGKNKENPLDDEDFVKNHWITFFDNYNRSEANVYANFLFDSYFNLQSVYDKSLTARSTEKYVKSLQKCSVRWNQLHHPRDLDPDKDELKTAILGVHRSGLRASFKPILLAILRRKDSHKFIKTINLLEEFSFKVFDISNRKSNTGDSRLYSLANDVYQYRKDHLATEEEIKDYISYYYWFEAFENLAKELFTYHNGFYSWSGIRYFLFQYDVYLRESNSTTTNASKISWKDFDGKNSIEHIFPQSAALSVEEYAANKNKRVEDVQSSYEKIQNNWSAFSQYEPAQRKRLANSLGNLLAISSSDNASFGNAPYLHKVDQSKKGEDYKNRGYKFDSMSAMLVASEYEEWTPETITDRGLKMLEYMCDYIGEDFSQIEEKTKYQILGLDFMFQEKPEN